MFFSNPQGSEFDLGKDGEFKEFVVLIGNFIGAKLPFVIIIIIMIINIINTLLKIKPANRSNAKKGVYSDACETRERLY